MPVIYKCPNCGAAMEFDSDTQKLGCSRCGTQIDVSTYEKEYASLMEDVAYVNQGDSQKSSSDSNSDTCGNDTYDNNEYDNNYGDNSTDGNTSTGQRGKMPDMKIYNCQSCGAQLVADEYTSATFCSYCGNPTLVEDRLQGEFRPQVIIPFKINKDQAVEIYKKWLRKGPLTPKELSTSSTIEKISGVYVPFWLYSYYARTHMNAHANKVRTTRKGDTEYTYTDHFDVYRDVKAEFDRIPADASEKMPDKQMDMLEPYNYEDIENFAMPYLSGYLSERFNYTPDEIEKRAKDRADKYITDIARDTINGYSSVSVIGNDVNLRPKENEYALLPVWMLNFRFNNKEFHFYLNGQTGKIVADRPISAAKAVIYGAIIFVIVLIITMLGGLLFI